MLMRRGIFKASSSFVKTISTTSVAAANNSIKSIAASSDRLVLRHGVFQLNQHHFGSTTQQYDNQNYNNNNNENDQQQQQQKQTNNKTTRRRKWGLLGTSLLVTIGIIAPVYSAYYLSENVLVTRIYLQHVSDPEQGLRAPNFGRFKEYWNNIKYHNDPYTDLGIHFENVEFNAHYASDDADHKLRGWYIPPPASSSAAASETTAVILVHGSYVDRREMLRHVEYLHNEGYALLLYDARDHGISDGKRRGCSMGVREHEDVLSAVRFVKEQKDIKRVAVFGTSGGAAAAIMAASKSQDIDAVIAENPFAVRTQVLRHAMEATLTRGSWGKEVPKSVLGRVALRAKNVTPEWFYDLILHFALFRMGHYRWVSPSSSSTTTPNATAAAAAATTSDVSEKSSVNLFSIHAVEDPLDVVARIAPRPILLMHGMNDRHVPVDHSKQLYEAALEPKALWLPQDASHGKLINKYPEEYQQRVLGFLREHLPATTTTAAAITTTTTTSANKNTTQLT